MPRRPPGRPDPERARFERMEQQIARELRAESDRAQAETERARKQRERDARDAERAAGIAAAEQRTDELERQVTELESILRGCVARRPLTLADLAKVTPRAFEPGDDGAELPEPHRPVMPEGNWFNRRARREWFDQQMTQYQHNRSRYEAQESARRDRLAAAAAEHDRREAGRRSTARRRAATLSSGLHDGDPTAIENFAQLAINALPIPSSISLDPSVVYRADPRELVIDLHLPDEVIVPQEKSRKYVQARGEDAVKERPKTERESIYRAVLAQLPLAAADVVFRAFEPETVTAASVNGKLTFVDPATGRRKNDYLVSLRPPEVSVLNAL